MYALSTMCTWTATTAAMVSTAWDGANGSSGVARLARTDMWSERVVACPVAVRAVPHAAVAIASAWIGIMSVRAVSMWVVSVRAVSMWVMGMMRMMRVVGVRRVGVRRVGMRRVGVRSMRVRWRVRWCQWWSGWR